jgi:hypothetical protein
MLSARIELRGENLFCGDTSEGGVFSLKPLSHEAHPDRSGGKAAARNCYFL